MNQAQCHHESIIYHLAQLHLTGFQLNSLAAEEVTARILPTGGKR